MKEEIKQVSFNYSTTDGWEYIYISGEGLFKKRIGTLDEYKKEEHLRNSCCSHCWCDKNDNPEWTECDCFCHK